LRISIELFAPTASPSVASACRKPAAAQPRFRPLLAHQVRAFGRAGTTHCRRAKPTGFVESADEAPSVPLFCSGDNPAPPETKAAEKSPDARNAQRKRTLSQSSSG
jgi:hypothetical protein